MNVKDEMNQVKLIILEALDEQLSEIKVFSINAIGQTKANIHKRIDDGIVSFTELFSRISITPESTVQSDETLLRQTDECRNFIKEFLIDPKERITKHVQEINDIIEAMISAKSTEIHEMIEEIFETSSHKMEILIERQLAKIIENELPMAKLKFAVHQFVPDVKEEFGKIVKDEILELKKEVEKLLCFPIERHDNDVVETRICGMKEYLQVFLNIKLNRMKNLTLKKLLKKKFDELKKTVEDIE